MHVTAAANNKKCTIVVCTLLIRQLLSVTYIFYLYNIPVEQDKQHEGIGRQARVAPQALCEPGGVVNPVPETFCIYSTSYNLLIFTKQYSTGVVEINRRPVYG